MAFKALNGLKKKIFGENLERGQGMVEYALIIAFVVGIAIYLSNDGLGSSIRNVFSSACNQITNSSKSNGTSTSGS